MSDLQLGGLGILFSRLNGESMYLDASVSVEPSSLKLDSDYSLIYEYIIDDIYCRGEGMGREGVRSNII